MNIKYMVAGDRMAGPGFVRKAVGLATSLGCLLACSLAASSQTVPVAIVSQSKTVVATINGNAGHVAANTAGDSFYVSQGDNAAYWLRRGSSTPIALMTGLSGGRSIDVDSSNNVYIPSNYSGSITEIPYVNGTYATGVVQGQPAACSSVTPTAPCTQFGSGGAVTSYYYQPTNLGFDASGNAYVIDEYAQTFGAAGKQNAILKWTRGSTGYTATYISQALPQNNSAQIAVSPNGDVYYADGSNLYMIASGATKATQITTTAMTNPAGVSTDQYGNVFVTNSNVPYAILEIPADATGAAQLSKLFTFSQGYSANGIAFDTLGDYFYTGYSSATNLNVAKLYSFGAGSLALGTASTTQTATLLFTAQAVPATIAVSGPGFALVPGSCAAGSTYSSGSSCTVSVTYTPTAVGLQRGAVVLADSTGASIVTVGFSGIGLGAAQTSDPGTLTTLTGTLKTPQAVAVDGANNLYIADPGAAAVYRYASGATTSTTVGTGLSSPTSVAVDGVGNVYIADSGNGRVVEVPLRSGVPSSAAQVVIASGLGSSLGIALDLDGNLYIADAKNAKVSRLGVIDGAPNAGATSKVVVSGLSAPIAVATDAIGDLFIADATANSVTEVINYGKGTLTIGSGYSHPSGLATDAAGSLYIADAGNNRLVKVPFEAPIYNTNDQYLVGSTITAPYGVAIDSSANLYVVDSANAATYFVNRSQGTLALGRANLNTPTATLTGYVGNSGNQALKLGTPDYVATGTTAPFTISTSSSTSCVNGASLAVGSSCILSASFDPTTTGNFSELLSFSSNALNTATPSVTLTGVGLNLAPTTITLAQNGTAVFGQAVSVTATISSTKAGTPTGTVTFYVDGGVVSTQNVNGTTVTVSLSGLTGGGHTVAVTYTGDNNFAPSTGTVSITLGKAGSAITVVPAGTALNPVSAQAGTLIGFTATVLPGASTVPTGKVVFTYGSTLIGTATVAPLSGASTSYIATIATTQLPAGTDNVVATYSGDTNYASSSVTIAIIITPMTYTVTPGAISISVPQVGVSTATVSLTSLSGYNGYVSLACTGLPANTTCGFSPNGIVLQASNLLTAPQYDPKTGNITVPATYGSIPITVTVVTGTTPVINQPTPGAMLSRPTFRERLPITFALLSLTGLLFRKRTAKRFRAACGTLFATVFLFSTLTLLTACSASVFGYTPTGTYNVTVTATSVAAGYSGTMAPGCSTSASASTAATPTCTQTVALNLTVTPSGSH